MDNFGIDVAALLSPPDILHSKCVLCIQPHPDDNEIGMTGSHGGGDLMLVEDFVRVLQGEEPSVSCTNINDSINGHLAVFRAEKSRKSGTVTEMPAL